jgi:hypothetical protein
LHKNKIYYLGIEDKNGKEITSDSLIKFNEHKGQIFYSLDDCRFKIKWEDGSTRGLSKSFAKQMEVV